MVRRPTATGTAAFSIKLTRSTSFSSVEGRPSAAFPCWPLRATTTEIPTEVLTERPPPHCVRTTNEGFLRRLGEGVVVEKQIQPLKLCSGSPCRLVLPNGTAVVEVACRRRRPWCGRYARCQRNEALCTLALQRHVVRAQSRPISTSANCPYTGDAALARMDVPHAQIAVEAGIYAVIVKVGVRGQLWVPG